MEAIIDYRGKTPKKTDSGIPLITAKIIKNGSIQATTEFIAEKHYDSWMRRGLPAKGDVVMTTEAPLGEVAQLDGRKVALAQRVITLRGKSELLDNTFLKYLLISEQVQHQLDGRATGTTVKGIKQSELRKIMLGLPPLEEQKAIARILGTLDDKIELNRQMNATLEAMAQALFKSWFVDFDPAIDNALAAGNLIPEPLQARADVREALGDQRKTLPEAIQNQFPDRFVFNDELGWVPEGWEVGTIGSVCSPTIGGLWGDDHQVAGSVPAICLRGVDMGTLREFGTASDAPIRFVKPSALSKRLFTESDLLIAGSGAGPCGRPLWCSSEMSGQFAIATIYSNFVKRVTATSPTVAIYLDRLLFSKYIDGSIQDFITGTSVPNLDLHGLLSGCRVVFPDQRALFLFESLQRANFKKLYSQESAVLVAIRDTLLPKLLSGELRVPDAERLTARVT